MDQFGQVVWRGFPCALAIGSLICLVIAGLGCTRAHKAENLYFLRIELQNLTVTSHSVIDTTLEHFNITHLDKFIQALDEVNNTTGLNDFYSIGLWSYCTGNITDNGTYKTTYFSKPRGGFWFDPIDTWGLNGTNTNDFLPGKLKKSLNMYRKASLWMAIIYLIAVIATVLEIMTGLMAVGGNRLVSCFARLLAGVSLLFTTAMSITSTAIFATLAATVKTVLKPHGITGHMGRHIYAATWLAVVLSFLASALWLLDCCCCSRRRTTPRPIAADHQQSYGYSSVPLNGVTALQHTAYPPAMVFASPPNLQGSYEHPMHQAPSHSTPEDACEPYRHV
ncbi:SUR7/PalI family-domain-containing protein [Aspergillus parasiticus]|uniref:SUR7/PalI family-domain-containing protein n=1 Tax=Aspergillus parasiticus TaxID=5067 RepID=A0A5N6DXR4_ASPPA|nr:SUR7/PalI family-domain-containing protein [Aspergillus parasiticus]